MNQLEQKKEQVVLPSKPINEALELAKELGLKRQVEILSYLEWKESIPYKEVLPENIRAELQTLMTKEQVKKWPEGSRLDLAQIKVENYGEKLPMSVLIRMKEAKEYGFDEYQIWRLEPKVDPVLVGVKYEGEEEEVSNYLPNAADYWQALQRQSLREQQSPPNPYYTTTGTTWAYQGAPAPVDHSGRTWFDGGSPEKVMRKVKPHFFELCRWF